MTLVAKVLGRGELQVNALGLKHHADFSPQLTWFLRGIVSQDERAPPNRNHQRGKNAKYRGLSAAVRPKQAEQFRRTNVKRHSV